MYNEREISNKFTLFFLIISLLPLFTQAQLADSIIPYHKKNMLFFPIIDRSAETDWGFGGVAAYFFNPSSVKSDTATRTSDISILGLYTLNKQLIFVLNSTMFFAHEDNIVRSQNSYSYFPDHFWGLGNNVLESADEGFSQRQYVLNEQWLRRVHNSIYVGGLYEYQYTGDVKYTPGGVFDKENIVGRHGGNTSGLGLILSSDTRNHAYTPTKGTFAEVQFILDRPFLGSSFNNNQLSVDIRRFISITKTSVLAAQAINNIGFGIIPFRKLQEIGGTDMMRGYYSGRYTDKCMLAYQAEWRQYLFWRIGVVGFGAIGQVSPYLKYFNIGDFHYTYGGGLRVMISKKERLNLRVDYGMSDQNTNTVNIQLREAF